MRIRKRLLSAGFGLAVLGMVFGAWLLLAPTTVEAIDPCTCDGISRQTATHWGKGSNCSSAE